MVKTHFERPSNWQGRPGPETATYQEGYRAGLNGLAIHDNPHPTGTFEANEWLGGLAMGAAERRTRI